MDIQPSEISKILKEEIKNFGSDSEITEDLVSCKKAIVI